MLLRNFYISLYFLSFSFWRSMWGARVGRVKHRKWGSRGEEDHLLPFGSGDCAISFRGVPNNWLFRRVWISPENNTELYGGTWEESSLLSSPSLLSFPQVFLAFSSLPFFSPSLSFPFLSCSVLSSLLPLRVLVSMKPTSWIIENSGL